MAYTNNPENPINIGTIAGETAKTMALWPIYQYQWNPGMYSISRGQLRMPFSGQGLKSFARGMRRLPFGNKAVEWVKNAFDIDTSSNVMRSKEIWWGLGADKSRFQLGLNAVVDKPLDITQDIVMDRNKLKAMRMSQANVPNYKSTQLPKSVENLFRGPPDIKDMSINIRGKRINPNYKIAPIPMNADVQRALRRKEFGITGRPSAEATKIARMSDKGFKTFSLDTRTNAVSPRAITSPIPKNLRDITKGTTLQRAARGAGYGIGKTIGMGKKIAPMLGRTAFRGAMLAGKGFAYYQIGKLMWDAINFVMEPVGRASVQAMDSAFKTYESVPQVEMGGQIAMSYLTHGASTERQRAISAISKAHLNGRSVLGQESVYAHR